MFLQLGTQKLFKPAPGTSRPHEGGTDKKGIGASSLRTADGRGIMHAGFCHTNARTRYASHKRFKK